MRRIKIILFVLAVLALNSNLFAYEKEKDGVLFELKKSNHTDPGLLKIQICTEEIIRVIAAPGKAFSERQSLMVDKTDWPEVDWSVKEVDGQVEISTSKVKVKVNPETGNIVFFDSDGNTVLQENENSGKIITPAEVLGEKTYHIQQLFNSPDDEAFYGLGAHQNGVMNYKNHDVDLYQLNIINAVSFLISSRNYGILWDNNSRTKFGDIREYLPISGLKLYNKDGKEGGLSADYFRDSDFKDIFASRNENSINYKFIDVKDEFPEGFNKNVKAVRWSGEIASDQSGVHKFKLYCCGYTKMWINDELVVDSWRQNWLPWNHFPKLDMEAGKKYKIKIEWIHTGGYIGLDYLTPEDEIYKNNMSLYSEVADQIDYYFIKGENADRIISGYREITGEAPMMPKWAMGLWQCRERYQSQEQLLDVVKEFRKRNIPLDNIVQDWFYWPEDKWGDHDFDKERYPDPVGMVDSLHNELNTHIMISVWPKFYVGTENYNRLNEKGFLYKRNVEKKEKDWVGPGYLSTFYDPYSQEARDMYWNSIDKKLFKKGFDAWWLDATEPDIHSNLSRKETRLRIGPTALGSSSRYLNSFSLMTCKAVYEGQLKSDPDKRVFILTRSAFPGQQRYSAATWSGDIATRWFDLKVQIPLGLNFCMSGIPYWTTDIGGFAVEPKFEHPNDVDLEEWRELQTRWFQFGTFCPLFRVHGQFPYREMFNIAPEDHPAYQTMLAYDKLRYKLMPYIYSLTGAVTQKNYTIMRALIMDFENDKKVYSIPDEYMFGPALLVNPVVEYKARSREVYLPEGTDWYELKSGKKISGGQTITAEAPYNDIPVFVKEGSIIPCGPEIEYASEKPADPVCLYVFRGSDGSFELYEDENINNNYKKGAFATIPFIYNEKEKSLTIGNRTGGFQGMLETRKFEIFFIGQNKPGSIMNTSDPDKVVTYNGSKIVVNAEE